MITRILCLLLAAGMVTPLAAQIDSVTAITTDAATAPVKEPEVYRIKPAIDIPLSLAGTAWTLYGFSKIYGRDPVPEATILSLDKNRINKFDRPVADKYSIKAKETSDMFFYGSMPLPLILMLDKEIRKDALKIALLYLEAMAITGTLYTGSAMIANRYRPYAYNPEVDMGTRMRGGARNSFFAGHVALVGTSTFFIARVFSDYHPDMKNKGILFGIAGAATAATGYLRMEAGQHFKSDVIVGVAIGVLSGILVPGVHKNRPAEPRLTLAPMMGRSNGFTALYKINQR